MERVAYQRFALLEDSHFWFRSRRAIFFSVLDRLLQGQRGLSVLEIGCGAGGMMGPLSRYGTVLGMDIDVEYLGFCRQRGLDRVLCGSGEELPFADASFDLIALFDAIEHIPDEHGAMVEIARVLKPGGRAFFTVPAYEWLWSNNDDIAHHQRRYTKGRLRRAMQRAGLRPGRISYYNTFLLPLIVPSILVQKLRGRLGLLPEGYNNTTVPVPKPLNWLFTRIMSGERHLIRAFDLPVGHSILGWAERA